MALKELELITKEIEALTRRLKGETDRGQRMRLIVNLNRLFSEVKKGTHG